MTKRIFSGAQRQSPQEVEDHFAGKGYARLKGGLAEVTIEFLRPIQQRVREITDERLDAILAQGRDKAEQIARVTLDQVFQRTGLTRKRPRIKTDLANG